MEIEVRDLVRRHGAAFTLRVPFLRVEKGTTFGLVGNNGAGKTTLLKLLLDLIRADEGAVHVGEESVARSTKWKASTGSYLDASFLLDFLTPEEFFDFVGGSYGISKDDVHHRVEGYHRFLGDAVSSRNRYIRDLSMGNAKKVGLVGAMLSRPSLLVLDEPFANLDPASQIRLRDHLKDLNEDAQTTLFLSSHDLGRVTEVCERIAVMDAGRIVNDFATTPDTLPTLQDFFTQLI